MLVYAGENQSDIIHERELHLLLNHSVYTILSNEKAPGYLHGEVNQDFLKKHVIDFDNFFYLSGSKESTRKIHAQLKELGVDEQLIMDKNS